MVAANRIRPADLIRGPRTDSGLMNTRNGGSASTIERYLAELFALQTEQLSHDERYHKDICLLPMHQRLNHMALHFSKYTGQLAECLGSNDRSVLEKTVIDIFVISLASANWLNLRLSDWVTLPDPSTPVLLVRLTNSAPQRVSPNWLDPTWLFRSVAMQAGRMAKACESLDHLEAYPYRETLSQSVAQLCAIALTAAVFLDVDLPTRYRLRLREVEKRSIFLEAEA